ncbi:Gfo/Idh/MocA family protein [Novipirellula artificiosorum]|uniref:Putative oxidoreductase YdgJ n=1 Tax=Novipirellula artificiosorum TaxID=2528016 RepID=A0A5C6D9K8_9BACT|nr:Gfo/Idh/MocA family oxidoreductase [Novipirellula artificiosorum]TWU32855.1 putative oxidoreductase YdgJ [Novipirellula artificiosorum]
MSSDERNYDLKPTASHPMPPRALSYQPPRPKQRHRIGLIGCGGISESHLKAYQHAGLEVVAFSDLDFAKASARRDAFYPSGKVYPDYQSLLDTADVDVVDVATPVEPRVKIIEAALQHGKHVLSQKPFVRDLAEGLRLADLADASGCRLAVNQNGRWAPHFSFIRNAAAMGWVGDVVSINVDIHWDHNWIQGTPFNEMQHVVLEDFAIHWFDFVASIVAGVAEDVYATAMQSASQTAKPPLLGTAILRYMRTLAVLNFDADTKYGVEDRTVVRGTQGTMVSAGPSLTDQSVKVFTAEGWFQPPLEGNWFQEGFIGTMSELLCAIEEDRPPLHDARDNLRGLSMCFAAVDSANSGERVSIQA